MTYWLTVATFSLIYGSLAISYNICVGYVGLLSIAHAAFFSIGAYAYGIIGFQTGDGALFPVAALAGILVAVAIATALGWVFTMLDEHYVIIGTFALQIIFTSLLLNLDVITGGIQGIAGIPWPEIGPWAIDTVNDRLIFAVLLVILTLGYAVWILKSPIGLRTRAARENPVAASSTGISVRRLQVIMFASGAGFAALAGSVYAGVIGFIDPTTFTLHVSITMLSMVVIGGLGNPYGALVGGIVIATLPALVQEFDIGASSASAIQQILFGLIMILMIILRPSGLFPENRLVRIPQGK